MRTRVLGWTVSVMVVLMAAVAIAFAHSGYGTAPGYGMMGGAGMMGPGMMAPGMMMGPGMMYPGM